MLVLLQVDKQGINHFCSSSLWKDQFISTACRALDEAQFVVPGQQDIASSAEGRRNLTDLQETAQWNGGVEFPRSILSALLQ